jgi:hypothetical protein
MQIIETLSVLDIEMHAFKIITIYQRTLISGLKISREISIVNLQEKQHVVSQFQNNK